MYKKTGKKWFGLSLSTISAIIILLGFAGIGMARYVMEKNKAEIAAAENFYFTSNLLKEDAAENTILYVDPSKASFTVNLYNYADEQRKTASDIKYTVTVVNGSSNPDSGTIANNTEKAEITITPIDKSKDVIVTATSTSPYKKELKATFKISLGNQYTIEDTSGNTAAVMMMTFTGSGGEIKLELPNTVVPDENNSYISKDINGNWLFNVQQDGIYTLILLKQDQSINLSGSGTFADSIQIN